MADNNSGFTLLEIVIAILILVIISTMTAFNINKSTKVKAKVERDMDDYSAVRDALIIMTKDINMAFHYVDITEQMQNRINQDSISQGKPAPFGSPPAGSNIVPTEKITGFDGQPDKLYFTTLSHVRTVVDSLESDQAKVAYYVKDVKSVRDGSATKGLIRREATFLDGEDIEKGGKETLLLENIEKLSFRYLGGDDKDWVDTWKSQSNLDDKTKNRFPDAVEITITTDREKRKVTLSTVASVHMPNNDFMAGSSPSPAGGTQPNPPVPPH